MLPAVKLADEGFALHDALARGLEHPARRRDGQVSRHRSRRTASRAAASGPAATASSCSPTSRRTLRAIAEEGPDAFYKGWIADRHRRRDEGQRRPHHRRRTWRRTRRSSASRSRAITAATRSISMPPPSSGGVALIEMLNILENFDLKARPLFARDAAPDDRSDAARATCDRARHLGDPDFSRSRSRELTPKAYAKKLAATIDPTKATSSVELGKDIVTTAPTEAGRDHALLGHRQGRHGGHQHLHARRRLRLAGGRQGRRLPAQQRDGRLQLEARRHEREGRHRHAGQPDRARQADAQLDDADDRREGRAVVAGHRVRPAAARSSTRCSTSCSTSSSSG